MKALLISCSDNAALRQVGRAIADGVRQAGGEAVETSLRDNPLPAGFDLVFIGFHAALVPPAHPVAKVLERGEWRGVPVALYCTRAGFGKNALAAAQTRLEAAGAHIVNALNLKLERLARFVGGGEISETSLVRARAFGERTARNFTHQAPAASAEKTRIPGYRKPRENAARSENRGAKEREN